MSYIIRQHLFLKNIISYERFTAILRRFIMIMNKYPRLFLKQLTGESEKAERYT